MSTLLQTDLVLCDRDRCTEVVPADEAVWDDELELAYCSREHLQEDQELRLALKFKWEDLVFYGGER